MINMTPKFGKYFLKYGGISGFQSTRVFPHIYHGVKFEQLYSILLIIHWMLENGMNISKSTYLLESDIHVIDI